MHRQVTDMIRHMASSQQEMANIIEAKRQIAVRMSQLIRDIPPQNPAFEDIETLTQHSMAIAKSIAVYLSSLADFEEALADNLTVVFKEVEIPEDEE
ncbi:hypothetical protein LJK88_11775 [Paenibacillus sp. P26]|nr:hypothetical protein LJK88_11775 [Paenibacillus sp. P26]UUZ89545.1 hypothetical protein LJK87_25915 [Paenibacillus sp. P25]